MALKPMLDWAEKSQAPISHSALKIAVESMMVDVSVAQYCVTLSGMVWGFLNSSVSDKATPFFRRAPELNGFEAWRLLCRKIDQGSSQRLEVLRKQVRRFTHETKVKNLDDIAATLTIFENLVNDFREAGGEEVLDATMKSDALEVLPESLREQLLWHTTKKDVSWAMWRDHVVDTAAEIQRHRGRAGINVVEPAPRLEAQQGEAPNKDSIMAAISEKITEILAVGASVDGRRDHR